VLTFTSSSTVRNFVEQVGSTRAQELAAQARVVTIGPITATTARELGLRVDVVATDHTIAGLVEAMTTIAELRAEAGDTGAQSSALRPPSSYSYASGRNDLARPPQACKRRQRELQILARVGG